MVSSVNDISTEERAGPVAGPGADQAGGAAELLGAISAVRRTARRAVRQAWAQPPLPAAQGELLLLVARRPGITVAESAQELHLAQNTVSTLVSRLTAEELLIRGRDAADGRAALLTITAKAQHRLTEYRDLRAELADRALADLSPADQQALAAAVPALRHLAEGLAAG
jgi:DNA-binding MarR family transcriptional regulator